jgi:predicted RNA-binding protein YlqC (UPF0109 family)
MNLHLRQQKKARKTLGDESRAAQNQIGQREDKEVKMKALIKYIAQALVDYPEDVRVSETEGQTTVIIGLKVAKDDIGKVLGKQGRTVSAMRIILSGASGKVKKRAILEIIESGKI